MGGELEMGWWRGDEGIGMRGRGMFMQMWWVYCLDMMNLIIKVYCEFME